MIVELNRQEPFDDTLWCRWRRRIALWAFGFGILLLAETELVYGTGVLIDALYHGREIGQMTLHHLPPAKREKMLERMQFTLEYLRQAPPGPVSAPAIPE